MNLHLAYIISLIKKRINIKIINSENIIYICLNPVEGEIQNWEYKIINDELFRINQEESVSLCKGEEVVQFLNMFK